jgi:hypothetical protein
MQQRSSYWVTLGLPYQYGVMLSLQININQLGRRYTRQYITRLSQIQRNGERLKIMAIYHSREHSRTPQRSYLFADHISAVRLQNYVLHFFLPRSASHLVFQDTIAPLAIFRSPPEGN